MSPQTSYDYRNSHEIASRNNQTYTYDPQGNLTQIEDGLTISYNDENQSRRFDPPGASMLGIDLTYAGGGQSDRRSRNETGGLAVDYTPNVLGLGEETKTPLGGSAHSNYFTRTDSGAPLAMRTPNQTYYYLTDSLGSIVAMVDDSGSQAANYRYDPFGEAILESEQTQNPYRPSSCEEVVPSAARSSKTGTGSILSDPPCPGCR